MNGVAISFILCSRNDSYMGNAVGRLEIVINYLAEQVRVQGREEEVEAVVADWGSEIPLREVLNLTATAAKITRFVEVPMTVVKEVQKDSPYAEVLALNAAVRHCRGDYIGRIDQDTIVGGRFLRRFFDWIEGRRKAPVDLERTYLFSCRREVPFEFASQNPSLGQVSSLLGLCGSFLRIESDFPDFFFGNSVGIMLLHRSIWEECGGYDERLLYWGWMEIDLAFRLEGKYPAVNLGPLVGTDFFHLEHYDPSQPRKTPRKKNPKIREGLSLHPNDSSWGLINYPVGVQSYDAGKVMEADKIPRRLPASGGAGWMILTALKAIYSRYRLALRKSRLGSIYRGFKQPVR